VLRGKFITAALLLMIATAAFSVYWVYQVDKALCNGCANCIPWCPENAISMIGQDAWIDPEACTACGDCLYHCPRGAIYLVWYTGIDESETTSPRPVLAPNPSDGFVSITGLACGKSISVFDTSGRQILTSVSTAETTCLNLPGSRSGLYILFVDGTPALTFTVLR
jgi:NAD-dependent dihydropyrimidine dehydrogenase PreA subunit